jgi:predicted DNA-binding protein (MmcQ/YjbR family)
MASKQTKKQGRALKSSPDPHPHGRRFLAWRAYLLSKPGAKERHPFDPALPVYFVKKKMFALYGMDESGETMNLKCHPDWSVVLRQEHQEIIPGYHMNKKHWNTVDLKGKLPRKLIKELVDCSYDLVSGKVKALGAKEAQLIQARSV